MRHFSPPYSAGSMAPVWVVTTVMYALAQSTQRRQRTLRDQLATLFPPGRWHVGSGAKDVLIEPVEIVLHDCPARLRLRRPVTDTFESLVDHQLRRHAAVLQPAI